MNDCGMPRIALNRIRRELIEYERDPKPDIFVLADEDDIRKQHALIIGPKDTPYEGGFFYFSLTYPNEYPFQPPKVKLMTTANHTVRFNPNLYAVGHVCLSILNTWNGTPWSPALTVSTVLISIQSLMNEEPYHNEPGYEKNRRKDSSQEVKNYNDIIVHETLRVAVCGMLEGCYQDTSGLPIRLRQIMEQKFKDNYEKYAEIAKSKCSLNSNRMIDPFGSTKRGTFDFDAIMIKMKNIYDNLISINPEPMVVIPQPIVTNKGNNAPDYDDDFDFNYDSDSEIEQETE